MLARVRHKVRGATTISNVDSVSLCSVSEDYYSAFCDLSRALVPGLLVGRRRLWHRCCRASLDRADEGACSYVGRAAIATRWYSDGRCPDRSLQICGTPFPSAFATTVRWASTTFIAGTLPHPRIREKPLHSGIPSRPHPNSIRNTENKCRRENLLLSWPRQKSAL